MYILLSGISYKTAPVEIREKFAFCGNELEESYRLLMQEENLAGAVIINTCNRTEIYASSPHLLEGQAAINRFLAKYSGLEIDELMNYLYTPNCYDAISHLFRVASGLDSMVVGETQIIGQVKEAYARACQAGATETVMNTLFHRAIRVGKKVRAETGIDQHPVSVSYVAVDLVKSLLGDLQGKSVLVVGAGETAELATSYLMDNGVNSVIVSNRSYDKAVLLAEKFDGRAIKFDELPEELLRNDIVISCTAANHAVLRRDNCRKYLEARQGREIILIDIAVPRDVEPELANIDGVYVYDIDDLQGVISHNHQERQKAAEKAMEIVCCQIQEFNDWLATLYVVPVITAMKKRGERVRNEALKKTMNRLGAVSPREALAIEALASSIVNQMLRPAVLNLKEMASSNEGHLYAEVLNKLFNLQVDEESIEKRVEDAGIG